MLRFTLAQTAPSNSHPLGGGENLVRRTEPNRTIGAVHPSLLPCISRKSLDWCSFYSSSLPLSVIAGKVSVGRGRPKYHHQRAASSCPRPDQPLRLIAPLRENTDQPGPGGEQCWDQEVLLLKQTGGGGGDVSYSQGINKNKSVMDANNDKLNATIAYTVQITD